MKVVEKQKESLHIHESCKENGDSLTGLTEFERAVQEGSFLEILPSDIEAVKAHATKLLELAKKELFKDLPKWRKSIDCSPGVALRNIVQAASLTSATSYSYFVLTKDGWEILISDLEELPKEEEK